MTDDDHTAGTVEASLRSVDGAGIVRLEGRFASDIDDVWSALTDPGRLVGWLGEVEGDLRSGGTFRARYFASGWEGTGRVEACEPPHRMVVVTQSPGEPDGRKAVTLTADGEQTTLVVECLGLPLDHIAAYGAGNQIHVEDLGAYLAGRERCDARTRWEELHPGFQDLAVSVS